MTKHRAFKCIAIIAFFATVLSSVSNGQVEKVKDGYLLQIKYKKGQVIKQSVSMTAPSQPKLASSTLITTKCLDVDKLGNATLEITTPSATKAGNDVKKIKVDKFGTPSGNTVQGFSGNFAWPEMPLKIGQTWNGDMNLVGVDKANGFSMKATYKFIGFQTINKVKVATVTAVLKVGGTFDMSGTGTINLRVADGQVTTAVFKMSMVQFSNSSKRGNLNLIMSVKTL